MPHVKPGFILVDRSRVSVPSAKAALTAVSESDHLVASLSPKAGSSPNHDHGHWFAVAYLLAKPMPAFIELDNLRFMLELLWYFLSLALAWGTHDPSHNLCRSVVYSRTSTVDRLVAAIYGRVSSTAIHACNGL